MSKTVRIKPGPKSPVVERVNRLLEEQAQKMVDPRYEAIRKFLPQLPYQNWQSAKGLLESALSLLGMQQSRDNIETPARFLQYIGEFINPSHDPSSVVALSEVLGNPFPTPATERDGIAGMVVQTNIPFRMACGHHLLPAMGHASIGYIPRNLVVGLSKLARLVDWVATREPGMQEKIGNDIADGLLRYLEPIGVIVVISAEHTCMGCRGVACPDVPTITSTLRGAFRDNTQAREEFFNLISTHRR